MSYEITGTVTEVFPIQSIGSGGFTKREFRIKEDKDSKWPNFVSFTLKKEKCSLADSLTEGTKVKVHFNIEGRIWDPDNGKPTKCFIDLTCWKIDILEQGKPTLSQSTEPDNDFDDNTEVPF